MFGILTAPAAAGTDTPRKGDIISGRAEAVDADTIRIDGRRIRLFAIEATEMSQCCIRSDGSKVSCGKTAAQLLGDFLQEKQIRCEVVDIDRYRRPVAVCWMPSGQELNRLVVQGGLALAARSYSTRYVAAENEARLNRRFLWSMSFEDPAEWRPRKRNKEPVDVCNSPG